MAEKKLDEWTSSISVEDMRERKIGWMGREPSVIQIPLAWHTEAADRQPQEILS
jgi:hypothetical protein